MSFTPTIHVAVMPWAVDQANAWLAELTYRPGWSFEVRDGGNNVTGNSNYVVGPGLHLIVKARVVDSNDPEGALIQLNHQIPLDHLCLTDRRVLYDAVLVAVIKVETHEAMEYLRHRGERVCTPHPDPPGTVLYEPGERR